MYRAYQISDHKTTPEGGPLLLLLGAVLLGAVLTAGPAAGQPETALAAVARAFEAGDAQAVLGSAAGRVELALLTRGQLYSRAQATYVLQEFFRTYPPTRFAWQSEAQEGGSWIAAGRYWHGPDAPPMEVYVRLRRKGDAWELREVRIEQRLRD